jgi:hypothetical protein
MDNFFKPERNQWTAKIILIFQKMRGGPAKNFRGGFAPVSGGSGIISSENPLTYHTFQHSGTEATYGNEARMVLKNQ